MSEPRLSGYQIQSIVGVICTAIVIIVCSLIVANCEVQKARIGHECQIQEISE